MLSDGLKIFQDLSGIDDPHLAFHEDVCEYLADNGESLMHNDQSESTSSQKKVPDKDIKSANDSLWNLKFEAMLKYKSECGNCNVPQKYKCTISTGEVVCLGKWVSAQRAEKRKNSLRPDRYEKFQKLVNEGVFEWEPSADDGKKWQLRFEALVQYAKQKGNCNLPKSIEVTLSDGSKCNLYNWLQFELSNRRKQKLKKDREQLFQENLIDKGYLVWDKKHDTDESQWDLKFQYFLDYAKNNNGNYNVPG